MRYKNEGAKKMCQFIDRVEKIWKGVHAIIICSPYTYVSAW